MNWFALVVKPQHEKAVAEQLQAKALEHYLPLYRARRRWSDRMKAVDLPLFPRYVFCRFGFEERLKVLSTPSRSEARRAGLEWRRVLFRSPRSPALVRSHESRRSPSVPALRLLPFRF